MKNCNFLTAFYHQFKNRGTKTITMIFPIAQFGRFDYEIMQYCPHFPWVIGERKSV